MMASLKWFQNLTGIPRLHMTLLSFVLRNVEMNKEYATSAFLKRCFLLYGVVFTANTSFFLFFFHG